MFAAYPNLSQANLDQALNILRHPKIDFGDIYCQKITQQNITLEEQQVKKSAFHTSQGCGIRAVCADKTGFAYSHNWHLDDLLEAAKSAAQIKTFVEGDGKPIVISKNNKNQDLYPSTLQKLSSEQQSTLLHTLDTYARKKEPHIIDFIASIASSFEEILIASTDNVLNTDTRPIFQINVRLIVEKNGKRETGHAGMGGRNNITAVTQEQLFGLVDQAIHEAQINVNAKPAPAKSMTVVLGNGWPGILLHEAVGHGLEADFNRNKSSVFSDKIGQQITSTHCTIIDDGSIVGRRGSLQIDDEGNAGQHNVLIENGILKQYMQDKLNARLMDMPTTGNGRRESFAHLPMPRMTNTYMQQGKYDPQEIIASVDYGLYATNFSGGQVDITNGNFVFSASQAWMIEKGKITHAVKGATLTGNGPNVMQNVSMVANDLKLDPGMGVCGKNGQSVPVGVGQPTIKISQLTVGGTAT